MTDFQKEKLAGAGGLFREKWAGIQALLQREVKKTCAVALGITAAAVAVSLICGVRLWGLHRSRFQDVTMELGSDSLGISQFLTAHSNPGKASFTEGAAQVDLNRLGDQEMVLRYGDKLESVTLHIVDTTPPKVDFVDSRSELANYVPVPEDFVKSVEDFSETTLSFAEEPVLPKDHSDLVLTVVVTDAAGNETRQDCTLKLSWLREEYTMELGTQLTKADLLARPELDGSCIDQKEIDRINVAGVGVYTVTDVKGDSTCQVTVRDTQGPELVLQPVRREVDARIRAEDFVRSVADHSGDVELRLMTELDVTKEGYQTVVLEAEDVHGNLTRKETTLQISDDLRAPILPKLPPMTVPVSGAPDYLIGLIAKDNRDGMVELEVDDSQVNLSVPGTYQAIYSATDKAGNRATAERTVEVVGNTQDSAELVKKTAAELSDDPIEIRNFVKKHIAYSHEWGEGDPVVYGLTRKRGNCYIHATCLQALLEEKGYETQLIWTTDKTHYWVVVKLDGKWRHMDATPGEAHSRYPQMTDEQRLTTLSGRNWDRTAWPECK